MLLTCILHCDVGPRCLITIASTVCCNWLLLRPVGVLRRRRNFTRRKIYVSLETFLPFLHYFDGAYGSRAQCVGA